MGSRREITAGAATLAILVVALLGGERASGAAGVAEETAAAPRAIVEVATPGLPTGEDATATRRRHRLRARSQARLGEFAARHGLEVHNTIPETGQLSIELEGGSVAELRRRLAGDPSVERVTAVRPVEFHYAPNDYAFHTADPNAPGDDLYQWNLVKSGGPAAWDLSRGGGAEVAVLDTGAYVGHPDLAGRISGTLDCTSGCAGSTVTDSVGHGTHVAGLACADSDGGGVLASLGFDCNLFIVRIEFCDDAADAVVIAANRGSDAINMSFGGCGPEMASPLAYAYGRGSVPVVAGANVPAPSPTYPAQGVQPEGSGPNIDAGRGLVVTAAKYDGSRASFAQATSGVSVAGYGAASDQTSGGQQGILSTFPPALPPVTYDQFGIRTTIGGDNRYAYLVGTSMAAPQVAGVVALMRATNQGLGAPRIVKLIKTSASHCGAYGNGIGWGVVNAVAAVTAALSPGSDVRAPSSRVAKAKKKKKKKRKQGARKKGLTIKIKLESGDLQGCADDLPASGVKVVNVYASRNGKRYRRIEKTKKNVVRFKPKRRGRYRFYSIAVDENGNREAAPESADEKVKVKGKKRARRRR